MHCWSLIPNCRQFVFIAGCPNGYNRSITRKWTVLSPTVSTVSTCVILPFFNYSLILEISRFPNCSIFSRKEQIVPNCLPHSFHHTQTVAVYCSRPGYCLQQGSFLPPSQGLKNHAYPPFHPCPLLSPIAPPNSVPDPDPHNSDAVKFYRIRIGHALRSDLCSKIQ